MMYLYRLLGTFMASFLLFFVAGVAHAQSTSTVRVIAFPTDATLTFTDNYGDPRSGHPHIGIDILGPKMTPLYAAVDGVVSYLVNPEASWGYQIVLKDSEGWTYHYIHVNNDSPGTDDGAGGVVNAYAPGLVRGSIVQKGQLVGWMGDSGNAEDIASHLHFEIHQPNGDPVDPYASLNAALGPGTYDVSEAAEASMDINTDKGLVTTGGTNCISGSLIKSLANTAVYYCGANGKRYVFPNDRVYFTWYADFKNVATIPTEQLASVPLGGIITYKPGSKLVKIESLPNVYAVERGGLLRWVKSPSIAASLYGINWAKKVDDISDAFFGSYVIGEPIASI